MPNALLTGVGRRRGIAAGIAAGLAEDGWDLALSYWHRYDQRVGHGGEPDDPERLADELRGQNRRIVLVPGDLEDPAVPAEVVISSAEQLGGLDALVMSHAESVDSGILDTTVESFDRHYTVNVRATWLLIAAFARATAGDRRIGRGVDQRPPSETFPTASPRQASIGWCSQRPMNSPTRVFEPTSSTQDRSTPAG